MTWLVIDGYEDEPAAFGVPPYVGFHIRYVCGLLSSKNIEYEFITIDQWRLGERPQCIKEGTLQGIVLIAGAVVPGKYLRGTPISLKETDSMIRSFPREIPIIAGGWAIRGWRQQGWSPLRKGLFLAVQDTDATLNHYLENGEWAHKRRTAEQWSKWAREGASSLAVKHHPDIGTEEKPGPLTYEVEVYQGCVRYKRGCKFCIEPKKGVPLWRTPENVIEEIRIAADNGVRHVRLGGMTDVFTYMAEGVVELEYPIPNPEPIAKLLHGIREDERIKTLHVDNGNPSIIAENLEPSEEITKTLVETLSDGAVLSFGLESADPQVHVENWLNCDSKQLHTAIDLINKYGKERGERGLPKLLPGLNFIAGLRGETDDSYRYNQDLLNSLKHAGLWVRRINIRQVEGKGFQEVNEKPFKKFKQWVREEIDTPLLKEMFPIGQRLNNLYWEAHDGRTRLPRHVTNEIHQNPSIYGKPGLTMGRQIGAYPILMGVNYHIPLETSSDVIVTGHGSRSLTGIEIGLDPNVMTERQFRSIPGIGDKAAWKIVSTRANRLSMNSDSPAFENIHDVFDATDIEMPEIATLVMEVRN